jgi:hypothetical protein
MLNRLNPGWTYTLLMLLAVIFSVPITLAERRWGMEWRRAREERLQRARVREQKAEDAASAAKSATANGKDGEV